MKVAVVLRCITGQLRTYINLQLSEGLKVDEFRVFFCQVGSVTTEVVPPS